MTSDFDGKFDAKAWSKNFWRDNAMPLAGPKIDTASIWLQRAYTQGRIAGLKEAINICDSPEFTEGLMIAKEIRTKIQELEKRG